MNKRRKTLLSFVFSFIRIVLILHKCQCDAQIQKKKELWHKESIIYAKFTYIDFIN